MELNTLQLDKKITAPGFLGAFPYDEIPAKPNSGETFSVILNTDPNDRPGDHWIALIYKAPYYYFCDSYGRSPGDWTFPPDFTSTVKNFIGKNSYKTNTKLLQQLTSNACGDYCVYFIQEMAKKSFTQVLSIFSTNSKSNDRLVFDYVKKSL